MDEVMSTSSFY